MAIVLQHSYCRKFRIGVLFRRWVRCPALRCRLAAVEHRIDGGILGNDIAMTSPSRLGADIEALVAADPRFRPERPPVQKVCFHRTTLGRSFAFERVTERAIRFWFEEDPRVTATLASSGLDHGLSVAGAKGEKYGRNSNLKAIFRDSPLLWVKATSTGEARQILDML